MTIPEITALRETALIQISYIPEGSMDRAQPEAIIALCDMVLKQVCPKCGSVPIHPHRP